MTDSKIEVLTQIDWRHGDLLLLGTHSKGSPGLKQASFDAIDAADVLQQVAEPDEGTPLLRCLRHISVYHVLLLSQGLRVILRMLKPHGTLSLTLFSKVCSPEQMRLICGCKVVFHYEPLVGCS